VETAAQTRHHLTTPNWRNPNVALIADGPLSISGTGYSLTVTGESTDNLVGNENSVYAVQPKPTGIGYTIVPRQASLHIEGETEHRAEPIADYFKFAPDAAFYRILYKSEQNDFTALVFAAPTPAELDERTKMLQASGVASSCGHFQAGMCIAIPREVGLIPLVSVTVNGAEAVVTRGGRVFQVSRSSGEPAPDKILTKLNILKPWNRHLTQVSFDRADPAILRLVLQGGETISWR
jgi:hypothetical protein